MSTSSNPLITTPPLLPSQPSGQAPSGGGFFSRIGAYLKQNPDVIQDIGDHLAAAFGNYAPMQMTRQRRADLLRSRLDQSQMDTATLNRQFLQKQIDNYQTPDQVQARAIDTHRAENPQQYVNAEGGIGVSDYDIPSRSYKPRTITEANPEYGIQSDINDRFRRNFPEGAGVVGPPTMPSIVTHPVTLPPQVGFHVTGYDANNNSIVESYSKSGAPMGTAPAPTPANIAVPTSAWKTYLETGRRNGMSDAAIVNSWNTQESTRTGIKMVPQPDGSVVPFPVTEGSVNSRGALASPATAQTPAAPPTRPPIPRVGVGAPGAPVGGKAPKTVTDAFNTLNQSQERYNVMQHALGDALQGDQQAMLNLLSNHLGMTMGLQKGARMNQALIEEAQKSTPWLQGLQARFDSRGYLTGVTLTPQQMQSMVKLAQDRTNEDRAAYQRAQDEAKRGFGMSGSQTPTRANPGPPSFPSTLPKIPPRTADEYLNSLPH